ncbi:Fanconi anemia group A protein homolog [Ctenocephalides felis]|uniref:Fanconi anemia group A protein homolog n=1 Tax=Ctenocephalides felis TaxID=7515 RepID=UPI000E6E2216|nr:Fanconi anemia group A protein homolog [Ctenocephalides felis]
MLLNQIEEFNINYLKELRERNVLTDRVIQEVYMDHLHTIVKHKPYVKVQMAIQHQSSWIKANLDKNILNMFTEIIQYISSPLDELVIIMKEEEISWKWCLIAASICLDIDPNSQKLKIIIDNLIHRAFDKSDADYLLISFLLVRQASYEIYADLIAIRHGMVYFSFISVYIWFSIKFGIDSIGPPSKDHASFKFLIGFLSSIIPYESEEILKMHLEKSFAAPPGSMSLIKEYKSLIQTRLSDINQEASQLH